MSTAPIEIKVSGDAMTSVQSAPVLLEPSLLLKPIGELSTHENNPLIMIVVALLPLVVVGVVWYQQRLKAWKAQLQVTARREQALEVAMKSVMTIPLNTSKASYQAIDHIFKGYIADKLHMDLEKVKQSDLSHLLSQNNVPESSISKVQSLVADVEMGIYSPVTDAISQQKRDEILSLLRAADADWAVP